MILAGDIGGTKTTLAVFAPKDGAVQSVIEYTFPSRDYSGLEAIITEFIQKIDTTIEAASFGVAGPVVQGRAKVTNLPWEVDEASLCDHLGMPQVRLLNDLEALAYAIPILQPTDLSTLNRGEHTPHGPIAVIAPGTGLGEAYLVWEGQRYCIYPSEGGHCSFAPLNDVQIDLLRYLQQKYSHVSYERVCSGIGIPNIYDFLTETNQSAELDWVQTRLDEVTDRTPVIVNAALVVDTPSPRCKQTLDMFVAILAAEASNLALKMLATGGVYIGGGIPPRILPVLQQPAFMNSFAHKGRFSDFLRRMPIHVILNPQAALLGAGQRGLLLLDEYSE